MVLSHISPNSTNKFIFSLFLYVFCHHLYITHELGDDGLCGLKCEWNNKNICFCDSTPLFVSTSNGLQH
jgi:hypothetical protein